MEKNKVYSGSQIKTLTKQDKFYKFINKTLYQAGQEYDLGEITCNSPFNPSGENTPGGIYVIERKFINHHFIKDCFIATIELYDDSRVYVESDKFKVDRFKITKIQTFDEFTFENNICQKCMFYKTDYLEIHCRQCLEKQDCTCYSCLRNLETVGGCEDCRYCVKCGNFCRKCFSCLSCYGIVDEDIITCGECSKSFRY
jgi:hypothetical protein